MNMFSLHPESMLEKKKPELEYRQQVRQKKKKNTMGHVVRGKQSRMKWHDAITAFFFFLS